MNNFRINVFSSPGLRKDTEYRELGEDAVGFLYEGNQVILWLADGAPGAEIVIDEGASFGSRLLARYIGECFEETAFKNKNIEPKEVFAKSLENVKSKLNDKFEGIIGEKLGLSDYIVDIRKCGIDQGVEQLQDAVKRLESNFDNVENLVRTSVLREKKEASRNIEIVLKVLQNE